MFIKVIIYFGVVAPFTFIVFPSRQPLLALLHPLLCVKAALFRMVFIMSMNNTLGMINILNQFID